MGGYKFNKFNLIYFCILFDKIYFKVGFQGVSISNMNDFRMNPGEKEKLLKNWSEFKQYLLVLTLGMYNW